MSRLGGMIVLKDSHMTTTRTETTITTPGIILGTPTRPHRWTGNEQYQFLSRLAMSRYTGTQPYGVISITDPDAPRCSLRPDPHRRGVLRLQFWDLEDEAWTGRNPIWHLDPKDKFSQSHADQIHNFVRATRHNKLTIVHCEAGISRSSGVAAALATAANCPDTDRYFTTPPAHPNWTVYRAVLQTLRSDLTVPARAPAGQYGRRAYRLWYEMTA